MTRMIILIVGALLILDFYRRLDSHYRAYYSRRKYRALSIGLLVLRQGPLS